MKLDGKRVLLTGASGGIGSEVLRLLLARGARVAVTARSPDAFAQLPVETARLKVLAGDLADESFRASLPSLVTTWAGGLDVLVNAAGSGSFALLGQEDSATIERLLRVNVLVPIDLTRRLLPLLQQAPQAAVLNVGSVLGAIGLAGNSVYCASKFALRGFSEALRRELADTNVAVLYAAPRATRTRLNSAAAAKLGNAVDEPRTVAAAIVDALERRRPRSVVGWPEKLFVRLNGVLPALVDRAVAGQLPHVRAAATGAQASLSRSAAERSYR